MGRKKKKRIRLAVFVILLTVIFYVLATFLTTPFEKNYTVSVENSEKMIALTFDDGPGPYTEKLLDGLKREDVKATFFLLGKHIDGYEAEVKRMKSDGHLIGNHTYNHITLFNSSVEEYIGELEKTDEKIFDIIGEKTLFFRPPHGFYTGARLNRINKIAILWQDDTIDWKHKDADYVYNYLLKYAKDGKIFLLHDTKPTTVEGVLRAIGELKARGYKFVRADELLCRNGDSLAPGLAYRACSYKGSPIYF